MLHFLYARRDWSGTTFHNHTTVLEGSKIWSDALLSSHNGKILKQY